MSPAARERQLEAMRQWRAEHPDNYRQWTKEYQQWRDSERTAGRNVRGNSRPRTKDNKISYSINVTDKLALEERFDTLKELEVIDVPKTQRKSLNSKVFAPQPSQASTTNT